MSRAAELAEHLYQFIHLNDSGEEVVSLTREQIETEIQFKLEEFDDED